MILPDWRGDLPLGCAARGGPRVSCVGRCCAHALPPHAAAELRSPDMLIACGACMPMGLQGLAEVNE